MSKKINFPVKVGNENSVEHYAAQLTNGEEQLLVTRDLNLYLTNGKGKAKKIGIKKEDLEELLKNNNSNNFITKDELKEIIKKIDIDSDGITDFSNIANKIKDVEKADLLSYYGKDKDGRIGFHNFPINTDKRTGIQQTVKLNVKENVVFSIDFAKENNSDNVIVQCFKYKEGTDNKIQVLKEFNNGDELNFIFNKKNIIFDGEMKINDIYLIDYKNPIKLDDHYLFESDEIDLNEFKKIILLEEV